MQLEGTLETFPLRELIEMVVYSSVTGVLEIQLDDGPGQIFFRDGLPYHAATSEASGFEAVCLLFEQHNAAFHFSAGNATAESTLWFDPWELIDRAEQMARAWLQVRPFIPNLDYTPVLHNPINASHIHINEDDWPVLSAIDGQRTIAMIAGHLDLPPLEVCHALIRISRQQLIDLRAPAPKMPCPSKPPASTLDDLRPSMIGSGFFERLLAKDFTQPDQPESKEESSDTASRYVYYPRRQE